MARDEQAIRRLAYELWQARGCPEGSAAADWFAAERRLSGQQRADSRAIDEAAKESFPASDPPAPPLPDKPPANAEEKWAAAEVAESRSRGKKPPAGEAESPRRTPRRSRTGRDANSQR
jgi:hypothetical protein